MQYDVKTPAEYLKALSDDWRKGTLLELREIILSQPEGLKESINYKMLCYRLGEDAIFHLNAQKGYVSLYVGNTGKIDPDGALLSGLNLGKGCIRFTKSKKVASIRIAEFIEKAVRLAKKFG